MAKILFINPVVREEDVPRHVPYGIALLAALAMRDGHLVQVYDANAWRLGPDVLRQVCAADDWDIVGVGGITTAYGSIKQIMPIIREVCPKAVIVLGGGVLTSLPREMMTWLPMVDVGVIGEAFLTFPEMCAMVDAGGRDWVSIRGTISRGEDGRLIMSPPRELLHDLDSLPYPAWDLFPLEEVYFPNSQLLFSEEGMLASRRLDVNSSYGCSLICRYCYHLGIAGDMRYVTDESGETNVQFDVPQAHSRTIRYHSPEYLVKMIRHMVDTYNVNFIGFMDENLMTMDKYSGRTWMKAICDLIHEYGLAPKPRPDGTWDGIRWSGTSHASLITEEALTMMRAAGCSGLIYGYESFSPHVMKTIGKGSTPKNNIRSFYMTLKADIRPIPNQIIGFPAEDFQSIRENMAAWDQLGIIVKPFFATAYPGSEWFTIYREQIEKQYGGDLEAYILALGDATRITSVISHNFNVVELLGLRELMLQRNDRAIDAYEKVWRRNHGIANGQPSTLYKGDDPLALAGE